MPSAWDICCTTAVKPDAWLIWLSGMSAKAMVETDVRWLERRKPPSARLAAITQIGVDERNQPVAATAIPQVRAVKIRVRLKPYFCRKYWAPSRALMEPSALAMVRAPACSGVQPSPPWSSRGSRNGMAPSVMRIRLPPVWLTR